MLSTSALFLALLASPLNVPGTSPIAAEVDGKVITRKDLDKAVAPLMPQIERRYKGAELEKKKEEFASETLDRLIEHMLLLQTAKEAGITVEEKVIDAQLDELAMKVGGWARLLAILSKAGMSLDEKTEQVREGEMVKKLLAAVIVPRIYTGPEDLRRYYDEHPEEFEKPAKYRISQIIVWKKKYRNADEAKRKLDEIGAMLKAGQDFAEVARKHSDGPHAAKGGDWGLVSPGDLIEELARALPGTKAGDVKGPVESKVGFHLIKITEVQEAEIRPFRDVQESIRVMMRKRAYVVETQKFVEELRRRSHVKIYESR